VLKALLFLEQNGRLKVGMKSKSPPPKFPEETICDMLDVREASLEAAHKFIQENNTKDPIFKTGTWYNDFSGSSKSNYVVAENTTFPNNSYLINMKIDQNCKAIAQKVSDKPLLEYLLGYKKSKEAEKPEKEKTCECKEDNVSNLGRTTKEILQKIHPSQNDNTSGIER
jgi:hypothetical protein